MRGNSHVRFGGRSEETDPPKGRHRASARSNHTHATLLLKAGVAVKVVSERLGHASPGFTLNVCQHVVPGMQAEAAQVFDSLLEPAGDEASPSGQGAGASVAISVEVTSKLEAAAAARGVAIDALLTELLDGLGSDRVTSAER